MTNNSGSGTPSLGELLHAGDQAAAAAAAAALSKAVPPSPVILPAPSSSAEAVARLGACPSNRIFLDEEQGS
jgi:hypothetical protein